MQRVSSHLERLSRRDFSNENLAVFTLALPQGFKAILIEHSAEGALG